MYLLKKCNHDLCNEESKIRCMHCKFGYCSGKHRKEHWPSHKDDCKKVQKLREIFFKDFFLREELNLCKTNPEKVLESLYKMFDKQKFPGFSKYIKDEKEENLKMILESSELEDDFSLSSCIYQICHFHEDVLERIMNRKEKEKEKEVKEEKRKKNKKEKNVEIKSEELKKKKEESEKYLNLLLKEERNEDRNKKQKQRKKQKKKKKKKKKRKLVSVVNKEKKKIEDEIQELLGSSNAQKRDEQVYQKPIKVDIIKENFSASGEIPGLETPVTIEQIQKEEEIINKQNNEKPVPPLDEIITDEKEEISNIEENKAFEDSIISAIENAKYTETDSQSDFNQGLRVFDEELLEVVSSMKKQIETLTNKVQTLQKQCEKNNDDITTKIIDKKELKSDVKKDLSFENIKEIPILIENDDKILKITIVVSQKKKE